MAGGKTQVRRSFMKSGNKFLQWLTLVLCIVMLAAVLVQTAGAAEPTDRCLNPTNEGVEYFTPMSFLAKDADIWRGNLHVTAIDKNNDPVGTVTALEVEIVNSSTRYQCTEINPPNSEYFSCNSMPANSIISGIYFRLKPTVAENTEFSFKVEEAFGSPAKTLYTTISKVKMPPYPCARNYLFKDFVAEAGSHIVFYTEKDCNNKDTLNKSTGELTHDPVKFIEQKDPFAIVNIINTDTLKKERVKMKIAETVNFDFDIELRFKDKDNTDHTVKFKYEWDPVTKTATQTPDGSGIDGLTQDKLPLTLIDGKVDITKAKEKDGWGLYNLPSEADLDIYFWYENTAGTLGYENSIFHFERNLNIQFSPTCKLTAPASALYDSCQATKQLFTANLPEPVEITGGTAVTVAKNAGQKASWGDYHFLTRKCVNATCDWVTSTSAYVYSINMSDGGASSRTYTHTRLFYSDGAARTRSRFRILPYSCQFNDATGTCTGNTLPGKKFAISALSLVAEEPGTYVVYAFVKSNQYTNTTPVDGSYEKKFFITINDKDQLDTCSTLANNGYFKANWNDCLDPGKTQLLTFEHIAGKEEAWMENRSNADIYFPYVQEWSYLPQKLQIASLTYKATALTDAGRPGLAWCNPEGCLVPPYTKVTITGGTFYLDNSPKFDEYRVAYARRETYNIAHLFFNVYVKECEKKIPNTGISLRSPLKVNERIDAAAPLTSITRNSFQSPLKINAKVNDATSYVFTGNSLRIPAIGLGMETPIPIVHVYYEEGSDGMKWDLSTLGNYVGELEGGSYIPYGGNSVLTGHYWSGGVFKNLEGLNLEDEIYIYGNDGVKYIYKVVQKFIAQPEDVYEMFQQVGDRSLTLVTCENYNLVTDEYERRYIVRAVLESQDLFEEGVW